MRRVVRGHEIPSNRVRTASEEEELAKLRQSVVLYELQGDLVFATAEKAHRTIVGGLDDVEYIVIDFRYVTSMDEPARAVLDTLAETLADAGRTVVTASNADHGIDAKLTRRVMSFLDHDAAIEWCEERLLQRLGSSDERRPHDPARGLRPARRPRRRRAHRDQGRRGDPRLRSGNRGVPGR